jgi:polyhydroxyalkanoate synthesis regulator phasin
MTDETQSIRDRYQAQARSALDKLRGQVDELRVQADLAQAEARERLGEGVEGLRHRQGEAKVKLDEAQAAGADMWKSVAKQAEEVVDELGDAFSKVAAEVQSAIGKAGAAAAKGRDAFLEEWKKDRAERERLLDEAE